MSGSSRAEQLVQSAAPGFVEPAVVGQCRAADPAADASDVHQRRSVAFSCSAERAERVEPGTEHRLREVLRDALSMRSEVRVQMHPSSLAPIASASRSRADLVFRQLMRLFVVPLLQPILDHAQISIRCIQLRDSFAPQQSLPDEQRQHGAQLAALQTPIAAAAHQLERLHDELDLANAARAELDVVLQLAPLDLARDHRLHLAQRFEHAEVEVAPIDERPQHFVVQLGVMLDRGQRHAP